MAPTQRSSIESPPPVSVDAPERAADDRATASVRSPVTEQAPRPTWRLSALSEDRGPVRAIRLRRSATCPWFIAQMKRRH